MLQFGEEYRCSSKRGAGACIFLDLEQRNMG